MNSLLVDQVRVNDGSPSVVEEVSVDDVAGEEVVDDDILYGTKPQRQYAATTLRTSDYLKGRPRMNVGPGRPAYTKLEPGEEVDEDPPRLSDPDGTYGTPSMRPHFRMYADATIKKADRIFQEASTSRSAPSDEGGEDGQIGEEELQRILDGQHAIEQQEGIDVKPELFYTVREDEDDDEEQGQHAFDVAPFPLYSERPVDFPDACDILLGNKHCPTGKVCKTVPQNWKEEGTAVVYFDSRRQRAELGQDGLGSWGKPSGRTRFYAIDPESNKYVCVSDSKGQVPKGVEYDVKVSLLKYDHPTTMRTNNGANRFVKKIITCVNKDGLQASRFAVITYEWLGTPFNFTYSPTPSGRRRGTAPPLPSGARNWEAASLQLAAGFSSFPPTCAALFGECPLYSPGAIQFADVCLIITGDMIVDSGQICDRVPQRFRECGTFVVDVHALASEQELRRDDNGQWGKPAGNSRYFKYDVKYDGTSAVRIDKSGKLEPTVKENYDFQILCKRYELPATGNRFVRKIYTGRSRFNNEYHRPFDLAVITYFWKGDPIPFETLPQRKVRLHNASEREMLKRAAESELAHYEAVAMEDVMLAEIEEEEDEEEGVEEGVRGGAGGGGGTMYMEHAGALVDMLEPQPARKRRKELSQSMPPTEQQQQQSMRRDGAAATDDERECAKMALENQMRFSKLLDRLDSVAESMERMTDMQMNMMWRARQQYGVGPVGQHGGQGGSRQQQVVVEQEEEHYEVEYDEMEGDAGLR